MTIQVQVTGDADYGRYVKLLVGGEPGSGKGVPLDTRVATPSGWRAVGDLVVGDEVIGASGAPVLVTAIYDRGQQPINKITLCDGTIVITDDDHLWSVQTRKTRHTSGNFMVRSTKNLLKSGLADSAGLKYFLPLCGPAQLDKVDLPIDPYLLGVLLANGSFKDDTVTITTNDEPIIQRVRQRNPEWTIVEHSPNPTRRWGIHQLHPTPKSLGLDLLKSREKFVPSQYLTADEDSRRELLAGLMDCDGSAGGTRKPQYHTTSPLLRDAVIELVQSLGGVARINIDKRDPVGCWNLCVSLPFNPFTLPRKTDRNRWAGSVIRRIESIEPAGTSETRCLTVDALDGLFVLDGYVVTHNTLVSSTAPHPIYASAEGGLMSIADRGIPYIKITGSDQLLALLNALDNPPDVRERLLGRPVETVVVDTIDEIGRILLRERLEDSKKDMLAIADWGWYGDQMRGLIRAFRGLEMHVIFTCHIKSTEDAETGRTFFKPSIQGAVGDEIAAYVDLALLLRAQTAVRPVNGEAVRQTVRFFQTTPDLNFPWIKDRSGKLPPELEINFVDDFERIHNLIFGKIGDSVVLESPQPTELTLVDSNVAPGPAEEVADLPVSVSGMSKKEKLALEGPWNCEECGVTFDNEDQRDLSVVKLDKILDGACFKSAMAAKR